MKKLTIDRALWRRGGNDDRAPHRGAVGGMEPNPNKRGEGPVCLLNGLGFMCCLGFDALACGVPKETILHMGDPEEVFAIVGDPNELPAVYRSRCRVDKDIDGPSYTARTMVTEAIQVNDNAHLTDAEREAQLIPILQSLGWDVVEFVN